MDFNQLVWNRLSDISGIRRGWGSRRRCFVVPTWAELLELRELPAAAAAGFTIPANPDPLRSSGAQSTLVVRVSFGGDYEEVHWDSEISDAYTQVDEFYTRQSFGKLTFPEDKLTIVPDTVDLPLQIDKLEKSANGPDQIAKATENALTKMGYKLKDYLHLTILHPRLEGKAFDYDGLGLMPGNRVLLNDVLDAEVWAHELGHNAGAPHAGVFDPKDPSLSVADPKLMKFTQRSTGLDVMDAEGLVGIDRGGDMFALRKAQFGWLDVKKDVANVTSTGTYHLTAIDEGTEPGNPIYALRIRRNATQEYWIEYRGGLGSVYSVDKLLLNGVVVTLHNYGGDKKYGLLDMTPDSISSDTGLGDFEDAPLEIGHRFDDLAGKIHITPLKSSIADSIDVFVGIGDVSSDHAPLGSISFTSDKTQLEKSPGCNVQFTSNVQDPDNDPLTYEWDFGDGSSAQGMTQPSRHYYKGHYCVRLKVTDGFGVTSLFETQIAITATPAVGGILISGSDSNLTDTFSVIPTDSSADLVSDGTRSVVVWTDKTKNNLMAQRWDGINPVGPEIVVSANVIEKEYFTNELHRQSSAAITQDGSFVVAWHDTAGVFVRRFNASGEAVGPRIQISAEEKTTHPVIAISPTTGQFVVAWGGRPRYL